MYRPKYTNYHLKEMGAGMFVAGLQVCRVRRLIGFASAAALLLGSASAAQTIQIDGTTATSVTALPGGGLGVTIAAPNSRGVSHNSYTAFSVDAGGAILGNEGVGAAVIVNEVTGTAKSRLAGTLSVAGDRADVVVVNPNGIEVNGARVSNVRGLALMVGRRGADTTAGALRFAIGTGRVEVLGAGLSGDAQRVDIAGETVAISGPLTMSGTATLGLHAGQGGVELQPEVLSVNDPAYLALVDRGNAVASGVALIVSDSALLSGGRILMTADDRGAGVAMSGRALASTGEFQISADGRVTMAGSDVTARTEVRVTGGQGIAASTGSLTAQTGYLILDGVAADVLTRDMTLASGAEARISGLQTVDLTGTTLTSPGNLSVTGDSFSLSASMDRAAGLESFSGSVSVVTSGDSRISGAVLSAGTSMTLRGGGDFVLETTAADKIAVLTSLSGPLELTFGGDISNQSGRLISAGDLTLISQGQVINGAIVNAATQDLRFGQEIGQIRAAKALSITATGGIDTTGGTLDGDTVTMTAAALRADRQMFGAVKSERSCFLVFCRDRLISAPTFGGGTIAAAGDLRLTIGAGGADIGGGALSGAHIYLDGPRFTLTPVIYRTAYAGTSGLRGLFSGKRLRYLIGYESASISTVARGLTMADGTTLQLGSADIYPTGLLDGFSGVTYTDPLAWVAQANGTSRGIFASILD